MWCTVIHGSTVTKAMASQPPVSNRGGVHEPMKGVVHNSFPESGTWNLAALLLSARFILLGARLLNLGVNFHVN